MQLVGVLDSPFVRRVAISFRVLELAFEHRPLSVFRNFQEFQQVNPVVKAPSLICDDGEVLMDSTLILQYAERLAAPRTLMPRAGGYQHALRILGLALAACEKSVQVVYERQLRPPEKQHQPWLDRVQLQVRNAFAMLEDELRRKPLSTSLEALDQPAITTAVVWQFAHSTIPDLLVATEYPCLAAHSAQAESLPVFIAFPPTGPGVPSD